MPEETQGTRREIWGNVRGKGGKHVGNCCLKVFLRHLFTRSQTGSYIDRTTHKCWGISNVAPHTFFFVNQLETLAHKEMAEALDDN